MVREPKGTIRPKNVPSTVEAQRLSQSNELELKKGSGVGSGCLGILTSPLGSEDMYSGTLGCWSISVGKAQVGEAGGEGMPANIEIYDTGYGCWLLCLWMWGGGREF